MVLILHNGTTATGRARVSPCHFPLKTVPKEPEPILWPSVIWPSGISQSSLESLLPRVFCHRDTGFRTYHRGVPVPRALLRVMQAYHLVAVLGRRRRLALPLRRTRRLLRNLDVGQRAGQGGRGRGREAGRGAWQTMQRREVRHTCIHICTHTYISESEGRPQSKNKVSWTGTADEAEGRRRLLD